MLTFQEQFQQYLSNSYYPNNPPLNQGGEPNIVEPINTFDISPELKKKLKKERKTISPIRQYANDTLQFDETTGTGQFDFSDPFKLFNIAAQGITGFANANNDAKNRRLEEQMYLQSLIPKPSFNYNEDGLNNIPMYKGGGQNPAKVYTDRKQFEQAQRMYNDSLLLYTLSEKQRLKGTNNKENILFNKKGSDVLDENERRWYQDTRKQLKGKFFPDSEVTIKIQGEDDRKRPNSKENDYNNDEYFHPDIKPIKGYNWSTETGLTRLLESNDNFLYKKPVQPVVYQPQFTNTNQGVVEGKVIMNDGKNAAILNSKIVPKMKRLGLPMELKNQERIPSLKGQPIPLKIEYPEQKGNPVYGPGNTIVGYSDNMNFSPAYQYTGAPNNQLNLQDKELLNNPEALRKYVIGKDNYKFKTEEYKSGGGNPFVEGSVHDISEEEIKQLIKKGFKIKYL
jgi:hypothetical protein